MLIIHGRRTARIKKYTDNSQACQSCKTYDLDVRVYRDYYHLFFIPLFPIGEKTVKAQCNACGEPMWLGTMEKHYEDISKTPFYYYTIPILFGVLLLFVINSNLKNQKEKALFVDNPKVGDVYRMSREENNKSIYYFLRISRINGDTIVAYHSNLEYNVFISNLNDDDFFVKDEELYFLKPELKKMLENDEINSVERGYGEFDGFNRIK